MNQKNHALATRFAVNLVGAMLQRSSVDFFYGQSTKGEAVDFLVQNGTLPISIKVRYVDDPRSVDTVWASWHKPATDTRLVIVTANGNTVLTDSETASMLMPDQQTSLSILPPVANTEHEAMSA